MDTFDQKLSRFKVYRWLSGGYWFKLNGKWIQPVLVDHLRDGTVVLYYYEGQALASMHETNISIQAKENWK